MKTYINKYKNFLEENGKSAYTVQAYVKDIEQLFTTLQVLKLKDVDEDGIKKYIAILKKANYDLKSISRKINSIRSFFKHMKEQNYIKKDPSENIHHPKIKEKAPRYLTKEEYTKLRNSCLKDIRTYAMIELLLQTGIRIGELCRLKVSDICYKSKTKPYAVRIEKNESTPSRTVPLNSAATDAISMYFDVRPNTQKNSYVFVTKAGKPIIIRNARTYISRAMKKAKITNATVNDLRNTFIYHHIKNGENILKLSQIVGHKNLSSTIKYTKIKKGKTTPKTQIVLKNL
ncbi:MAG: tyrosine-type recombinase/integrase [bacterium]